MAAPKLVELSRFEDKVEPCPASGCWLWIGRVMHKGYGVFFVDYVGNTRQRKFERAHRAAWRLFRGPVPEGLCVLHKCDVRCCVNPSHLFLGTHQDNADDMIRKGRAARRAALKGA